MVESASKFNKLLLFSKNRPTSVGDTAISPPIVSHTEALRLPKDFARALPYVAPTSPGRSGPTPMTEQNKSQSRLRSPMALTPREAVLRSKLEKLLTVGSKEFATVRQQVLGDREIRSQVFDHAPNSEQRKRTRRSSVILNAPDSMPRSFSSLPSPSSSDMLEWKDDSSDSATMADSRTLTAQLDRHGLSTEIHSHSPKEQATFSAPSPALSRKSSVRFATALTIRKKTSTDTFSRKSSSKIMSGSPSSIHFPTSIRRRNSSLYGDDLGTPNIAEGSIPRPPSKSRSERSYSQRPTLPWSVNRLRLPPPVCLGNVSVTFPSPSPFPRFDYAIHATATQSGEFFLFGGLVHDEPRKDLYRFSTRDRSAILLQTAGCIPSYRSGHASALVNNTLFVWGGNTKRNKNVRYAEGPDNGLYMLNLGTRNWTRADAQDQCPEGRYGHTIALVGSKLLMFGGQVDTRYFDELWSFDVDSRSAPSWQLYEPPIGSKTPDARAGHVSISHGDKLFIFGGFDGKSCYNDTWSFDASTQHWSKLECTGSIPVPREGHAAALVGDIIYVDGGRSIDGWNLLGLSALNITSQQWYSFEDIGPEPSGKLAMVSVGSKIFVLCGEASKLSKTEDHESIHILDTAYLKYVNTSMPSTPVSLASLESIGYEIIASGFHRGRAPTRIDAPKFEAKPYHCPKPYCTKSFKQANSLKYHLEYGKCTFAPPKKLDQVQPLSASKGSQCRGTEANGEESDASAIANNENEAESQSKPYACGVDDCQRSYSYLSGLRYHYLHSGDHGAVGLALLASGQHECLQYPGNNFARTAGCSKPGRSKQQPAEIMGPDRDGSETGSHSSVDEIESPWFDSYKADSDGLGRHTLPQCLLMDSDNDSWFSEELNETGNEETKETNQAQEAIFGSQYREVESTKPPASSFSNLDCLKLKLPPLSLSSESSVLQDTSLTISQASQQSPDSDLESQSIPSPSLNHRSLKIESLRDAVPAFTTMATYDNFGTKLYEVPPKIYKNLLLLLWKKISELGQGINSLDTLQVYVERMQRSSIVLNLMESSQYRTQLIALSSTLQCHDDNEFRSALDKDEADIVRMLQAVLNCDSDRHAVLGLRGNDAESFLTLIHNVIDKQGFPFDDDGRKSRHSAHKLLVKLSENCGILPSFLSIVGVDHCSKEPVAGGGFADIFRASYRGKDVALKRLRDFQAHQQREIIHRRFCREAILWQDLKHPNVLPFYGIDLETFLPRLSMVSPWMQHGTILKHITDLGGPLTANLDRYLLEIAQGLQYLHSRNIVHGDLRGTNIFIDDQWHVRLADFGLAGFADATLVTHTSNVAGSIRWMAPELHNPEIFDLKVMRRTATSDVYAFACVALEIFTGNYPFSDTPRDNTVILKVIQGQRPTRPIAGTGMTISDDLWCLIELCWQQAPFDRPQMLGVVERLKSTFSRT